MTDATNCIKQNNELLYGAYSGIIHQTVTIGIVIIEFKHTYNKEALWLHGRKTEGKVYEN